MHPQRPLFPWRGTICCSTISSCSIRFLVPDVIPIPRELAEGLEKFIVGLVTFVGNCLTVGIVSQLLIAC